jgi:hypothetical protein
MNIKCFIDLLKSVTTGSNLGKSSVQTFVLGHAAIFKFATEVESGYIHGDRQRNLFATPTASSSMFQGASCRCTLSSM